MATEYPCSVCKKEVITDAIECDICNLWTHRVCGKLKKRAFDVLSRSDMHYSCPSCSTLFPYNSVHDDEFLWLNSNVELNEDVFYYYQNCQNVIPHMQSKPNLPEPKLNMNSVPIMNENCKYLTKEEFDLKQISYSEFSLIHFNARSLNSSFDKITNFISRSKVDYQVIAVTETWFDSDTNTADFEIENYDMHSQPRLNKRGGGVLIYTHKELECSKLKHFSMAVDDLFEMITIEITIPNYKNKIISCIYRSPGSDVELFSNHIENVLQKVKRSKHLYICGDFNIDLLKIECNKNVQMYMEMLNSYGLYPTITKPTRISSFTATLIDNIFTNNLLYPHESAIICDDISDHLPVFCTIKNELNTNIDDTSFKYIRKMSEKNCNKFRDFLSSHNWDDILASNEVNDAYNKFISAFKTHYDSAFPKTKISCKRVNKNKPWMTKGLINACKKKNLLYKQYIINRTHKTESKYKSYKNKLTSILRFTEKDYYLSLLESNIHNSKKTWQVINEIIKKKKSSNPIPNEFIYEGKTVKGNKNISNGFNNYFTNVGPNLAKSIKAHPEKNVTEYMNARNSQSMFLSPVLEKEVNTVLQNCKSKSSEDCDDTSMNLLKYVFDLVIKPFTHICNLSFSCGTFPDKMKIAKVIPLYKSGDKKSFNNYRPVSVLSQFSKILEKLFDKRLQTFVDKHAILSNNQYGFRASCSTTTALIDLIEEISTCLDNRKVAIGVFIDLRKAFDTIDHKLLLDKLEHYGIRGIANNWLKSYLDSRQQYVQIGDIKSELMQILCGVPQGSVLGPKLFILYINDLCNVSQLLRFILFADDTNIFRFGNNLETLCREISLELDKLHVWFDVNKLSLNVQKTNFIIFGKGKLINAKLTIRGLEIEQVHSTKFLGVIIDDKLSWKPHISKVRGKLARCISVMYKAKDLINKSALMLLYNSLFLPHLTYCMEVWANTYKTKLNALAVLQKRALRLIANVPRLFHTNSLFKKHNLLKLKELIQYKTGILMYHAYHGNIPPNLRHIFTIGTTVHYVTRQKNKFKIQFRKTNIKALCVSSIGCKLWNALPCELTKLNNINKFKLKYKKYLVDTY